MTEELQPKLLRYLTDQSGIFQRQLVDAHRKPSKKNVHQLRVTTRRIRAALWLAKHGSRKLSFKKLSRNLRKLGQDLGSLRELDVAMQDARDYRLKTKKLKKRRRALRQKLMQKTGSKHRRKIVDHLDKAITATQENQEQFITPGVALLREKVLSWKQKSIATETDFHQLRILTKKARYILEIIGKPTQPLVDLQDALGKGHDLEVLRDISKHHSEIGVAAKAQYQKAFPMIQPALAFALKQLSAR